MRTSLFDLFKVGIGPSSSHTVGPMRAAYRFLLSLSRNGLLGKVTRVRVELYGSLGLMGHQPETVDPALIDQQLRTITSEIGLLLFGLHGVPFTSDTMLFHKDQVLPGHSNGMRFTALDAMNHVLEKRVYYSVGGGFITEEGEDPSAQQRPA